MTKGPGADTLPIKIYAQMRFGIQPQTNALFVVLFLVTLAGALVASRLMRRRLTVGGSEPGRRVRIRDNDRGHVADQSTAAAVVAVVRRGLPRQRWLPNARREHGRRRQLKVFNWSDYIDDSVVPEFEQQARLHHRL